MRETLERRGFESNSVAVAHLSQDDRNGVISVQIKAAEGPRSFVRSIRKEIYLESTNQVRESALITTNAVFSSLWAQDFKQSIKDLLFPPRLSGYHGRPAENKPNQSRKND